MLLHGKREEPGRASGGTGGWQANLNRKANGLALEGPSVGLYVPLLEFNPWKSLEIGSQDFSYCVHLTTS